MKWRRMGVPAMGLVRGVGNLVSGLLGGVVRLVSALVDGVLAVVLALVATVLLVVAAVLCATILLLPLGIPVGALALRLYAQAMRMLVPGGSGLKMRRRKFGAALRGRRGGWRKRLGI
ncbi:MAG TPA: hypothetical protein VHN18_04355 [Micromonosporaceae bacterium]|nr:hypothetical protein [Micromonosporaceae bacterium]